MVVQVKRDLTRGPWVWPILINLRPTAYMVTWHQQYGVPRQVKVSEVLVGTRLGFCQYQERVYQELLAEILQQPISIARRRDGLTRLVAKSLLEVFFYLLACHDESSSHWCQNEDLWHKAKGVISRETIFFFLGPIPTGSRLSEEIGFWAQAIHNTMLILFIAERTLPYSPHTVFPKFDQPQLAQKGLMKA
ncbi:unnamed protein product [Thlaspi arvense]|uniref:Uncharacterized protein n=1 Tax=Thlaspi arvense TaxID=13288 RepID=A0AAU9SE23_THLAR|nr:unnamed protein product [Thlaspi arvense]